MKNIKLKFEIQFQEDLIESEIEKLMVEIMRHIDLSCSCADAVETIHGEWEIWR